MATVISNVIDRNLPLREAILAPRVLWSTSESERVYVEIFLPVEVEEVGVFVYQPISRTRPPVRQSQFTRFGAVNAVHVDPQTGTMSGIGATRRKGHALGARY